MIEDPERVRHPFDDLSRGATSIDLLGFRAERAEGVRIFHRLGEQAVLDVGVLDHHRPSRPRRLDRRGVIGVIGPTRLNYARVIPMVDYTAKVVSKLVGG